MGTYLPDLVELNGVAPKHPTLNNADGFEEAHGIGSGCATQRLGGLNDLLELKANDLEITSGTFSRTGKGTYKTSLGYKVWRK